MIQQKQQIKMSSVVISTDAGSQQKQASLQERRLGDTTPAESWFWQLGPKIALRHGVSKQHKNLTAQTQTLVQELNAEEPRTSDATFVTLARP